LHQYFVEGEVFELVSVGGAFEKLCWQIGDGASLQRTAGALLVNIEVSNAIFGMGRWFS
jgi:hypothetical protein